MVLVLLIFAGAQLVLAQSTITGKVTNAEDGTGIPGATVLVKGTNYGVITDISGDYSLKLPEGARTLQFSFVGMKMKDVVIGTQKVINVALEQDVMNLEGVVVTALGISREKKSLGYAVEEVGADELNQTRSGNLITFIAGI